MPTQIKIPHPDDVTAGANVRRIRTLRRMSQETLADHLGITFQQVQKYEKGTNRISISRAIAISRALSCTVADLLTGIDGGETDALQLPAFSRQATHLAECFDKIGDERQRRHILGLVATLAHPLAVVEVEVSGRVDISDFVVSMNPSLYSATSDKEAAE